MLSRIKTIFYLVYKRKAGAIFNPCLFSYYLSFSIHFYTLLHLNEIIVITAIEFTQCPVNNDQDIKDVISINQNCFLNCDKTFEILCESIKSRKERCSINVHSPFLIRGGKPLEASLLSI